MHLFYKVLGISALPGSVIPTSGVEIVAVVEFLVFC